jgi:hypothetical protein
MQQPAGAASSGPAGSAIGAEAAAARPVLVPDAAELRRLFWDLSRNLPTHAQLVAMGACSVAAQHPRLNRYSDCWPLDAHLAATGGAGYLNATLVPRKWGAAPA